MTVTIPNHSILPATRADIPIIAEFLFHSKITLAINRFLYRDWPCENTQRAHCTRTIEGAIPNPESELLKVVADGTGEIVAHLVISHKMPAAQKDGSKENGRAELPEPPEGMAPEVFHLIMKATEELRTVMNGAEYLAITHMYVMPSSRRQGIGASLVKLALQKGKEKGLPVWVVSEPQARSLFVLAGFEERNHFDFDLREFAPENCGYGLFRLCGMSLDV